MAILSILFKKTDPLPNGVGGCISCQRFLLSDNHSRRNNFKLDYFLPAAQRIMAVNETQERIVFFHETELHHDSTAPVG